MSLTNEQLTQMAATFMAYTGWRMELDPNDDIFAWKSVYADTGAYIIRLLVVLEDATPKEAAQRLGRLLTTPNFEDLLEAELASLKERHPSPTLTLN